MNSHNNSIQTYTATIKAVTFWFNWFFYWGKQYQYANAVGKLYEIYLLVKKVSRKTVSEEELTIAFTAWYHIDVSKRIELCALRLKEVQHNWKLASIARHHKSYMPKSGTQ